jgi:hypothetical protein
VVGEAYDPQRPLANPHAYLRCCSQFYLQALEMRGKGYATCYQSHNQHVWILRRTVLALLDYRRTMATERDQGSLIFVRLQVGRNLITVIMIVIPTRVTFQNVRFRHEQAATRVIPQELPNGAPSRASRLIFDDNRVTAGSRFDSTPSVALAHLTGVSMPLP